MRVLSVDGGGFLGLATANFVAGIESHFGKTFHDCFDLFCGTSTGAIISLGLANGLAGRQLVELYRRLGPDVFHKRKARGIFAAKYDNHSLAKALGDALGTRTLDDLLRSGKHALVTAFCVTAGAPRFFKTNHSTNLTLHGGYRLCDVALASSAAPTFFPMVELTNPVNGVTEVFCDGGVVANHPALLGFTEAVYELQAAPKSVSILSLSTPREDLSQQATGRRLNRGIFQWRKTLASVFIDSNSVVAHETLRRIVSTYGPDGPAYERVEMRNSHSLALDDAGADAIHTLCQAGAAQASSNEVRSRLERFFCTETQEGLRHG
jgi:hypothetical protein